MQEELRKFTNNDEDDNQDENQAADDEVNQAADCGIVPAKNAEHAIHILTVIGQVEGHFILPPQNKTTKYEHIIPALVAIEQDMSIDGLLIILNTVGGDVEAGLAIAELIHGMSKPTVSIVVGGGHSIGVPLAVSARKSFIVPSATMTIHPVRMNGLVIGVQQSFEYFAKMQERINNFIVRHSDISIEKLRNLMFNTGEIAADIGSIIDGETAKESGLINKIGGLSDALGDLKAMCRERERNRRRRAKK